jgi:hypothetical protein
MIASMLLLGTASAALAQAPLQPFSALIGHCWAGPVEGVGTDTHCFESVFGGQHVRDRHKVVSGGREIYAGETLYSARGTQVIFTYWNSLGGLGTGNVAFAAPEWKFNGTIHATAAASEEPMISTWRMVAGGYEVRNGTAAPQFYKLADGPSSSTAP